MTENAPVAQGGLFEDLIEVLYTPSAVFDRTRAVKATKYVLVTTVVVLVIAIATKNILTPWLDAQGDLAVQLAADKGTPMPPEAAAGIRASTGWFIVGFAPLLFLIGPYVNAALIVLGAKLFKAPISFAQAAVVATLAGVPRLIAWIALPVAALVSDGAAARSLSDLSLGPARFFDPRTTSQPVMTLLANLDLFRFWQLALVAIGVSVIARVPRSTGALIALVMFGIAAMLQLIPSAFA